MTGLEGETAVIGLILIGLAWPALFAARKIAATPRPQKPKADPPPAATIPATAAPEPSP
jgi:hypothetical protein